MTADQEREMHELAIQLVALTKGTGWEAMRYQAIGRTMQRLAEYCDPSPLNRYIHHVAEDTLVEALRARAEQLERMKPQAPFTAKDVTS